MKFSKLQDVFKVIVLIYIFFTFIIKIDIYLIKIDIYLINRN